MKATELFERCYEIATTPPTVASNRALHEVLALCCAEGTRAMGQGFGNLFSQVDFLCKRHGVGQADRLAIQTARRHSNSAQPPSREDLLLDLRALCRLITAVFAADVPGRLRALLPSEPRHAEPPQGERWAYQRCIVSRWDDRYAYVTTADGQLTLDYGHQERGIDHTYLRTLLREGMQLNLLDCRRQGDAVVAALIVVEPDFLVDISTIAACFTPYGHHPLLYTVNRLLPRTNGQPMLLGNFAGDALDDLINRGPQFRLADTLGESFRRQALQFCTCEQFDGEQFKRDAQLQVEHLKEVVGVLFGGADAYDRSKALLEPSFVCERLGLQGRVDLMTADMRLLVEQKSGRNMNIERKAANVHREDHYVQLLLYYGILRYNFGRTDRSVDIRLLYSRYAPKEGLLVVNFYQQLFREAIRFRNQLVATEYHIARRGFGSIMGLLNPATLFAGAKTDGYFARYVEPPVRELAATLAALQPLERAYLARMLTFVYREQLYQKVGGQQGRSGGAAVADLWNMPLAEKLETGNAYVGLRVESHQYDTVTLRVAADTERYPVSNFRRGDMVYLYAYRQQPDVRQSVLYKGTLQDVAPTRLTVKLNDGQQNATAFASGGDRHWALEHSGSDVGATSAVKSLYQLVTAPSRRKALLLGQRPPKADESRRLTRSYHPYYDDILLRASQARDYFLLIGPPGTGKTSMALRFMVEEELAASTDGALLLTAYTNRAVDEICAMLTDAAVDYLRLGGESACDPRFRSKLLDAALDGTHATLADVRRRIESVRVVVATTSTLQARPHVFQLKRFGLAVVDEASQILEPNIVGLLASPAIGRFVLIGDHKQLPAVVQQSEEESRVADPLLLDIAVSDCRQSLFERLIRWEERCGRTQFVGTLRRQGRMHPDIAAFPNRMFYARQRLEPVPCQHQLDTELHYDLPSADALDDLLKQRRVLFLPTAEEAAEPMEAEAALVADLLRRVHRFYGAGFDPDKTVGAIVPYRSQIALIRQQLERLGIAELQRVSIDTVERYQGSQRDVIVYSFAVSHAYQLDFLTANSTVEDGRTIDRKLNVAMTRARKQLVMTGRASLLRENKIFRELIDEYGCAIPASASPLS